MDVPDLTVQKQVTLMARRGNLPRPHGFQHGAALLTGMRTARKPAFVHIGREFPEGTGQILLIDDLGKSAVKGGESRRIRDQTASLRREKLRGAGRMPPAPELPADSAVLYACRRGL